MTHPPVSWITEFGEDWAVPSEIADEPGLHDLSWHNDAMPSFGRIPDGDVPEDEACNTLRIWCDHPDVEQREFGSGKRFCVAYDDARDVILETDDPAEAVRAFWGEWRRRGFKLPSEETMPMRAAKPEPFDPRLRVTLMFDDQSEPP